MYDAIYWIALVALMLGVWYFLLVRPQRKKAKEHENLLKELGPGRRVITMAGIYGEIVSIGEDTVILKLEDGAKMKIAKEGIAGLQDTE